MAWAWAGGFLRYRARIGRAPDRRPGDGAVFTLTLPIVLETPDYAEFRDRGR
jgi:hypothetical protein